MRYAEFAGEPFSVPQDFVTFADEVSIGGYAKNAIQALYNAGILNEMGNNCIGPESISTRAQVAAILHRFADGMAK